MEELPQINGRISKINGKMIFSGCVILRIMSKEKLAHSEDMYKDPMLRSLHSQNEDDGVKIEFKLSCFEIPTEAFATDSEYYDEETEEVNITDILMPTGLMIRVVMPFHEYVTQMHETPFKKLFPEVQMTGEEQ